MWTQYVITHKEKGLITYSLLLKMSLSIYPNSLNSGYHPHTGRSEHLQSRLCVFILNIINLEDGKPDKNNISQKLLLTLSVTQ